MKIYLILIILFLGTCRGSDNRTDLQSQNEIRLSCIDKSLCLVLDEYIRAHPEFNILTLTTNVDTIDFTFNIKGLSHKRPYMILGPAAERGFDEIDSHQRPYPSSFFVYGKYKIFVFSDMDYLANPQISGKLFQRENDLRRKFDLKNFWMLYRDENDRILILTREIGMFMKVHLVKPTIEFVDWAEKHRIEIDN